ncbi:calcium-binding protein [Chachezhania sediminis]|uniref:calcium-binding protein n=1 Tax=Chachezhania sediminis TaxID=2599291 RepID=UPI00131E8799|nr:calcium-binding protein [Chachezhania sediminis]
MASEFQPDFTTVTIYGYFVGPNFVRGLAEQDNEYTVLSDTQATLTFQGGFDSSITYVQLLFGTGFSYDEDTGRYSGRVDTYFAYELDAPENAWSFSNLNVSLDTLNSNASDPDVTFPDLLVIPLRYKYLGGEYDDVYITGSFDDIARGHAGDDTFEGLTGNDKLYGGKGADWLLGAEGNDELYGGNGHDLIEGAADNDYAKGGKGHDVVNGGAGDDILFGNQGNDTLVGGRGNDIVRGGSGTDLVDGNGGTDELYGGAGKDVMYGGKGDDTMRGNAGNDKLYGEDGSDFMYGGRGNDLLDGADGTNQMFGQKGNDRLLGGDGTDYLNGGAGNDLLMSGIDPDFLNGGRGNDTLSGNGGLAGGDKTTDNFIFEAAFGQDTITDFEVGFDGIVFALGITEDDVTTTTQGNDVLLSVDFAGGQSVLLEGVAGSFDPGIDILYS